MKGNEKHQMTYDEASGKVSITSYIKIDETHWNGVLKVIQTMAKFAVGRDCIKKNFSNRKSHFFCSFLLSFICQKKIVNDF